MACVSMQEKYPYDAVLIDSCAFDPKCTPENQAALEIFELGQTKKGTVSKSAGFK